MDTPQTTETCDVIVLGAGYAGLMAALRLARPKRRLRVVLVSARDSFLERVRLQETIVAPVALRIPSLSVFVADTGIDFISGRITSLDADQRRIRIACGDRERTVEFRQAIYALGSDIDTEAVPGVAAHAYRLERGEVRARRRHCAKGYRRAPTNRRGSSLLAALRPGSRSPARSRPRGHAAP